MFCDQTFETDNLKIVTTYVRNTNCCTQVSRLQYPTA